MYNFISDTYNWICNFMGTFNSSYYSVIEHYQRLPPKYTDPFSNKSKKSDLALSYKRERDAVYSCYLIGGFLSFLFENLKNIRIISITSNHKSPLKDGDSLGEYFKLFHEVS